LIGHASRTDRFNTDVAIVDNATERSLQAFRRVARVGIDGEAADALRNKLIDNEQEILRLEFADKADARSMYKTYHDMADRLAERVMTWNLPAIVLLLICNGLVIGYVKDATLSLAIGNIVGGSISCLWQERQQIIGFFFGSSVGSKEKSRQMVQR